ncbi:hypothetical protein AB4Y43_39960, partial [Paraburkholderia sp. BR10872]|uniref:hypothetical protein n=1 Tax=Paraburkholderia sp. BR10872 TaxID=3236989 RepID=UPI0034D34D42
VLLVQQQHAADSLLDLQRCLSDLVMPGLVTGVIAARLFRDSALPCNRPSHIYPVESGVAFRSAVSSAARGR